MLACSRVRPTFALRSLAGILPACRGEARHGVGAMRYRNGNVYEGSWMDDHRAGKGTMRFETGDVYEGEWRGNLQHGRGKFTS